MSDRDEFGAFLVGFLAGSLSGAIAALLLAPQSGAETRTVIREKAIELKDKASESVDEAYKSAEHAALEARARFDELAKISKERASELQQKGALVLEEQKSKIESVIAKKTEKSTKG
jgi:gas vesicle protein